MSENGVGINSSGLGFSLVAAVLRRISRICARLRFPRSGNSLDYPAVALERINPPGPT